MSIVAQRLSRIKPSPTNVLTGKVAELKREGRDIIGLGDGNEWGDVSADLELSIHPQIVGGEYAFVNTEVGFDGWSLDWQGGEVGAGYKLDLAENVYFDGRVSWSYDDQFEGGQRRFLAGIGLRF